MGTNNLGPKNKRGISRVRNLDAMHQFMPYIMKNRCDSEVYMNEAIDITEALAYISRKNEETVAAYKMTLFHIILAATAKTILLRPSMNRYIAGKRYYQRDAVTMSFIVKKQFSDEGEESLMILRADEQSTLDAVARKVAGEVKDVREAGGNDLDSILWVLEKLPRPILSLFAKILDLLVYFDKMPDALYNVDPYHTTVFLANLGSIKVGAPYHHLTNYGTNSMMITVGEMHKEYRVGADGQPEIRDIAELGIVLDERIGDGYYFAKCVRLLKYLIAHPEMLEEEFGGEVDYEH